MKKMYLMFALSFFALAYSAAVPAGRAWASVEYAQETGRECAACHVNPLGGGELTGSGEEYLAGLKAEGVYRPLGPVRRAVRLAVGYLHLLAGVIWFGTIFYVHILLKPAYASKGLPKGELILGWTCIIVVGVTGALLAMARLGSFEALFATRFGVLLSVKVALFLVMAGTAALVTFVLGPRMKRRQAAAVSADGRYTPESLLAFDGREGGKALVAVEGVVYDVSGSRLWKDGRHTRHMAGMDLTDAIRQAPHGPDKLLGFPRAGVLVTGEETPAPNRPKAVFYVVAYLNLVLVFMVLGVVALWRWW